MSMNEGADFWRYRVGVNVIPANTKVKDTFTKWTPYQDKPISEEQHNQWKKEDAFKNGLAVVCGKVWHIPEKSNYYLCAIDCDNRKAIEELMPKGIEGYAKQTLIEMHMDDSSKCHFYCYTMKPVPKKSSDTVNAELKKKLDNNEIPALEVKGLGEHGIMFASPSVHKNGSRYEIIDCEIPMLLDPIVQVIEMICTRYGMNYLKNVSNNNSLIPMSEIKSDDAEIMQGHNRHLALLRYAGSVYAQKLPNMTDKIMLEMIRAKNNLMCKPPLEDLEVIKLQEQAKDKCEKKEETKTEIQQLNKLSEIDNSEYANKTVRVNAVIASNSISYNVPIKISAKCNNDSDKHNCVNQKEIKINPDNYVKFVEIPDYKRYKILEDFAQSAFTSDCNLSINEIETTTIRRLRIRPIVSSLYKQASTFLDDSGNEWSAYDVYVLQDEIQNLEAGKEIQVTGQVIADPKTGKITMLVSEIKYLDENKYDIPKIKELQDFCKKKTPKEIMDFLTVEFEKYSRIIKRRNVAEIGFLSFFSPLYIDFEGKKIASWVKSTIIGDSTTGKSETIRQMIILLRAGQIISGEMASVAGLAGASVQATGGQWFLDFGVLPMQDRKFLAIDGAHKLRKEELDRLAEAERNGKIEINKAAKGEAYARTRQIKIFNPVDEDGQTTIPMDSFLYPVQSLKHTLQIQSIARIDLCCFVSDNIEVKERNVKTTEPHDNKLEYLSDLVRFVWSNDYEIVFDEDVIQSVLDQATLLENKFKFDEYPLITNDQKYKLAKLASSLACLTCSFDDNLTKIIVKKEHIEYVSNLIEREYSNAGLNDLSSQSKFNEIDLDYVYNLTRGIERKINVDKDQALEIIDWITKQQKINRDDIQEEFTLSRDKQAQPLLTYLKNEKIIKMARNHYSIAKKGVSIARFIVNFSSPSSPSSTDIDTPSNKKKNFRGVSLLVELQALDALKIKTYVCIDCGNEWSKTEETLEDIVKIHNKDHNIMEKIQ